MELKDLTKKYFNKKKQYKSPLFMINPDVYWKFVLTFSGVSILALFGFGVYLMMGVNSEDPVKVAQNTIQIKSISKDRLNKVIEYFEKRAQASLNIKSYPAPVIDPSL